MMRAHQPYIAESAEIELIGWSGTEFVVLDGRMVDGVLGVWSCLL